ncbi:MAG: hypothetical protein EAZ44_09865 [Cytophagia bacterium]|nr:MAG: hypothetical protein EAZ44_09865 [Cytophagia bacterium]TAG40825.1 MAG: hypothetical protein EAZ31_08060 [Cytophagia bacterium]
MKKLVNYVACLLIVAGLSLTTNNEANAQTTRRVNNNPAAAAPFTTIQAAVNAAVAGDIILVEGSVTQYAGFTLNKQLTITGPGYFFNQGTPQNPVNQANNLTASILGGMFLANGCSGSTIQGFSGLGINIASSQPVNSTFNNITIRRNNNVSINFDITGSTTYSATGWLITQNYDILTSFTGTTTNTITAVVSHNYCSNQNFSNLSYRANVSYFNNIINNAILVGNFGIPSSAQIHNNIFRGSGTYTHISLGSTGSSASHNNNVYENTNISTTYVPQINNSGLNNITATNGNVIST